MRVAMISVHACPLAVLGKSGRGGLNLYVRELSRQLGKLGILVDVFTRAENYSAPQVVKQGKRVRVIHLPAGPQKHFPPQVIASYLGQFQKSLEDFTERNHLKYDLLHTHYWLSGLVGVSLKKRWQRPQVAMFHTLGKLKDQVSGEEEKSSKARLAVEEETARMADRLIAATGAEKEALVGFYKAQPPKIRIIPPGVDLSLFYPRSQKVSRRQLGIRFPGKIVLFVGRIDPIKKLETLIFALFCLKDKFGWTGKTLRLLIVGGSLNREEKEPLHLKKLIQELGMLRQVTFLGSQPQGKLPLFYSASDVLVLPSAYESFGLVALEAMASGLPVVASKVGGLATLVKEGKTGLFFKAGKASELAEKINQVLSEEALRQRLGRKGMVEAANYSWPKVARQILGVYQELLTFEKN